MEKNFSSRLSFVMASVGAAVGLGNIFRFPCLAVKYGLIFIPAYLVLLFVVGFPLLLSEMALGRLGGSSVAASFSRLEKKGVPAGYLCAANSFIIMTYYCVLFSFVLLAAFFSYKLFGADPVTAETSISLCLGSSYGFPFDTVIFLIIAWALVALCFGDAERLGKISLVGVLFAVAVIGALALWRGIAYSDRLSAFLRFSFTPLLSLDFWFDTLSQVFFSLSLAVGVIPTYTARLDKKANLPRLAVAIILFDSAVSLAATVIYATVTDRTDLSLLSSFSVYPSAFSEIGPMGAVVCFLFYAAVGILCLDSVFSYLKSVAEVFSAQLSGNSLLWGVGIGAVSLLLGLFLLNDPELSALLLLDREISPILIFFTALLEAALFSRGIVRDGFKNGSALGEKGSPLLLLIRFSVGLLCPLLLCFLILSQILL